MKINCANPRMAELLARAAVGITLIALGGVLVGLALGIILGG